MPAGTFEAALAHVAARRSPWRWPATGAVYVGEAGQIEIFDARRARLIGHVARCAAARPRHRHRLRRTATCSLADAAGRAIRRFDAHGTVPQRHRQEQPHEGVSDPERRASTSAWTRSGVIHAANPGKHRVERYTPDGRAAGAHRPLRRHRPGGLSAAAATRPTSRSRARSHLRHREGRPARQGLRLRGPAAGGDRDRRRSIPTARTWIWRWTRAGASTSPTR